MIKIKNVSWRYPVWGQFRHRGQPRRLYGSILWFSLLLLGGQTLDAQVVSSPASGGGTPGQRMEVIHPQARGLASRLQQRVADQLWQGRIAVVPETEQQARDKQELQKLIERLNGVQIRDQKTSPAGNASVAADSAGSNVPERALPPESNSPISSVVVPDPGTGNTPDVAAPKAPALGPALLKKLVEMADPPSEVADPFSIAEILYLSGKPAEAARFYARALKHIGADDGANAEKRAWILFQRANCLRHDQPALAIEMYQTLLSEHPNSPLIESAKTWLELAQWYVREKPVELIQECEQLKVGQGHALAELDS